ncbi:Transcription factor [Niveomyces insectorum RCEF 264]|uniref:Transcription factor n=1 Tax=Niveomyces insectorum RCEF 264 TaxID=1081102 RepID=A0A167NH22_9HYPO|nr:Transcription factor [Niveomyces insectorum RCEF 264]
MAARKASGAAGMGSASTSASVASSSGTPSVSAKSRADRLSRTHRGLTCANCRSRKTRCDGTQPTCKTCEVYRDACRYEKPPPMSQIVAMARRLQEAEQTIAELRRALEAKSDLDVSTPTGDDDRAKREPPRASHRPAVTPKQEDEQRDRQGRAMQSGPRLAADGTMPVVGTSGTGVGAAASAAVAAAAAGVSPDGQQAHAHAPSSSPRDRSSQDLLFDLSLDSNGKLCYVGPTSAVHNPPVIESHTSPIQTYDDAGGAGAAPPPTKSDVRTLLTAKAIESRAWEEFALGSAAAQTEIPRAAVAKLLQIHWVWIAPMFMWVYRPAFMRDMATGGKYYSPLLLTILCGHAARFQEDHQFPPGATTTEAVTTRAVAGDALITRARQLLGVEIHRPSSIPTVQALLQLSARDLAYGQISQAWLYSGMAFRMVSDLGLQHSSSGELLSLGNLNAEDLEIRRRLYWSCYFWDKAVSLYLGRMPTLVDLPFDSSPELLDDFAEHELWTPFYGASQNLSRVSVGAYPPMKSHAISCFENLCRLSVILCDIILQLYSRRRRSDVVNGVLIHGIRERLDAWRARTPPHLLCDPDNLPDVCCPPHILAQNLLYYATIILLHRPFYSSPVHHTECRQAADQLERLLLLLEQTFGFSRITYLMAYCVYTGASVMVQDVKLGDEAASRKIQTFLRALRLGVTSCPLVQRSLDIITESLRGQPAGGGPPPQTAGNSGNNNINNNTRSSSSNSSSSGGDGNDTSDGSNGNGNGNLNVINNTSSGNSGNILSTTINADAATATGATQAPGLPPDALLMRNYLPAFPYYNTQIDLDGAVGDPYNMAAMDIDAFSLLECFPENHLDNATAEWYMPQ